MNTWQYDISTWYPEQGTTFIGNGFVGGHLPIDGHGAAGNPYPAALAAHYVGPQETFTYVPHWLDVPLRVDGKPVQPGWVHFAQLLDMRQGLFTTRYTDLDGRLRVCTQTFCHREHRSLAAYELTIQALREVQLELTPQLSLASCKQRPTPRHAADGSDPAWELDWADPQAKVAQVLHAEVVAASAPLRPQTTENSLELRLTLRLAAGQTCVLWGLVVMAAGSDPLPQAMQDMADFRRQGYTPLRASHVEAMRRLWKDFDVQADDPFLARRAKSSMFYLLCGYRQDVVWGGLATGLNSKGAWGESVLWDTEFYLFPAMLPFHPELARNMLLYRFGTLEAARQNARQNGEAGARFAWQSRKTGRPFAGPFENERHVSSDVAFACWWYVRSTGDRTFAEGPGRQILCEVARNWASRAVHNGAHGRWEIHGVIPPDEHVWDHHVGAPINNSVMTNAYARWVLQTAAADDGNDASQEERRRWRDIAAGMYLPYDAQQGIYLEYEGYNGHPIKQADVGHLFFPLCVDADPEEIRRNIRYYADRERETGLFLTHSPLVYGAAMSRAGDVAGVREFLALSERNATGPFEVPRESNYATGPVVTGAGAFLGLLFYGVLGVENMGEHLAAHPCVPDECGSVEMQGVLFHGQTYRIAARAGQTQAVIEP
ncbi:MAG: hypothetical protein WBC59_06245 [Phycisphaerae bacterium]